MSYASCGNSPTKYLYVLHDDDAARQHQLHTISRREFASLGSKRKSKTKLWWFRGFWKMGIMRKKKTKIYSGDTDALVAHGMYGIWNMKYMLLMSPMNDDHLTILHIHPFYTLISSCNLLVGAPLPLYSIHVNRIRKFGSLLYCRARYWLR